MMHFSRKLAGTLLAFAFALALAPIRFARATTVAPVTLEVLARRADAVLVVLPRTSQSHWVGGRIDTDYDLLVLSTLRGTIVRGAHLLLRTPGGIVGNIGQTVPGVPSLALGETYVVFVSSDRTDPNVFYLTHLTAAVLPVRMASDGSQVVLPPSSGMPTGGAGTAMRAAGLPYDSFVSAVRGSR